MAKFLYLYTGGQMAETPRLKKKAMQEWVAWFGTLGDSVVDMGNPFGAGTTVKNGGCQRRRSLPARRLLDHQRRVPCGSRSEGGRLSGADGRRQR